MTTPHFCAGDRLLVGVVRHDLLAALGAGHAKVLQTLEITALALPLADRVAHEVQRARLAEVREGEDRRENGLQARRRSLLRQKIHLQGSARRSCAGRRSGSGMSRDVLDLGEVPTMAVAVAVTVARAHGGNPRRLVSRGCVSRGGDQRRHPGRRTTFAHERRMSDGNRVSAEWGLDRGRPATIDDRWARRQAATPT